MAVTTPTVPVNHRTFYLRSTILLCLGVISEDNELSVSASDRCPAWELVRHIDHGFIGECSDRHAEVSTFPLKPWSFCRRRLSLHRIGASVPDRAAAQPLSSSCKVKVLISLSALTPVTDARLVQATRYKTG